MNLIDVIKLRGCTLADVAAKMPNQRGGVGISRQAMSQIAMGSPRYSTLKDIAAAIGMDLPGLVALMEESYQLSAVIDFRGRAYTCTTVEQLRKVADDIEAQINAGGPEVPGE